MKRLYYFIVVFILSISFNTYAQQKYEIIIDAGSSGSRIYLYEVYYHKNEAPFLNLLVTKSITPGLSSFSKNPNGAIPYIDSLLKELDTAITNFSIQKNQLRLYLYATAGMRMLSAEKQSAIYSTLKKYFATQGYAEYEAKTIDGRDEAIYDWLGVNYLAETFLHNSESIGSLDMGGASAQISFEINGGNAMPEDIVKLKIGRKTFQLFAHSFLGLGADKALEQNSIEACYPTGYEYKAQKMGAFQERLCYEHIQTFLNSYDINKIVPKIPGNMKFYAFSKYYYVSSIYNITQTPIPFVINYVNNKLCNNNDWSELKNRYPLINPDYLKSQCFSAEYVYVLLKRFGFSDMSTNLEIVNDINGKAVGWSLGAALAQALKHDSKSA